MNQWNNFERTQNAALKADVNKEIYECECGCTWFESVRVNQFISEQQIVIGQSVPPLTQGDFVMLRCARCSIMIEPRVMLNNPTRLEEKKYAEAISDITEPISEGIATEDAVQDTEQK